MLSNRWKILCIKSNKKYINISWLHEMKIKTGELLISDNGHYYRVVEAVEDSISLMRINGYTLFSCKPPFIEAGFRPVAAAGYWAE